MENLEIDFLSEAIDFFLVWEGKQDYAALFKEIVSKARRSKKRLHIHSMGNNWLKAEEAGSNYYYDWALTGEDIKNGVKITIWLCLANTETLKRLDITIHRLSFVDEAYSRLKDDFIEDKNGNLIDKETGFSALLSSQPPASIVPRKVKKLLTSRLSPRIYIDGKVTKEEMLAQLCIYGIQSKFFKADWALWEYLRNYVGNVLKIKDKDKYQDKVTKHIVKNYSFPESPRSFSSYVDRTCSGVVKSKLPEVPTANIEAVAEIQQRTKQSKRNTRVSPKSKYLSPHAAAYILPLSRSAIYRAIYKGKIKPKIIPGKKREYSTPGGLVVKKQKPRQYILTDNNVKELKKIAYQKELRKILTQALVKKKNLSKKKDHAERAARAWIKRRLDRGQTLEQIKDEVESTLRAKRLGEKETAIIEYLIERESLSKTQAIEKLNSQKSEGYSLEEITKNLVKRR